MMIRSSILALLAIAAVAAGCSATAQSGPGEPGSPAEETDVAGGELHAMGPGGHMFEQADGDKDGKVTLAEAQASAIAKFNEVDANKDGQLEDSEMQAMHQRRGGPGGPGNMIQHLDKNADGKLSKEEAPERMREHFDAIDANKDGLIDESEMQAAHGQRGGPGMIKHLDKNGDGKISKEEAPERMRGHFDEIDANKDGQIEQQELQAMHQRRGGPEGPHAGARQGMMMKHLDANNDGKLSQAEFTSKIPQWFARADANGDGAITREELQAKRPRGPRGSR